MATTHTNGGASRPSTFDRGDWLGLAVFLAPIAIATAHWIGGAL